MIMILIMVMVLVMIMIMIMNRGVLRVQSLRNFRQRVTLWKGEVLEVEMKDSVASFEGKQTTVSKSQH